MIPVHGCYIHDFLRRVGCRRSIRRTVPLGDAGAERLWRWAFPDEPLPSPLFGFRRNWVNKGYRALLHDAMTDRLFVLCFHDSSFLLHVLDARTVMPFLGGSPAIPSRTLRGPRKETARIQRWTKRRKKTTRTSRRGLA
jgi:hypothetical protein